MGAKVTNERQRAFYRDKAIAMAMANHRPDLAQNIVNARKEEK